MNAVPTAQEKPCRVKNDALFGEVEPSTKPIAILCTTYKVIQKVFYTHLQVDCMAG
jgi:hypothetical protein